MAARGVAVVVMCVSLVFLGSGKSELLGKVQFATTKVWPCSINTSGELEFKSLKVYKVGRNSFVDVDIISKVPFDDNLLLTLKASHWVNGGFKPRLSIPVGSVCTGMKTALPEFFKALAAAKHFTNCPLPPANYSIRKFSASVEFLLPIPAGRYRSAMLIYRNDVLIGCVQGEANANLKKNG